MYNEVFLYGPLKSAINEFCCMILINIYSLKDHGMPFIRFMKTTTMNGKHVYYYQNITIRKLKGNILN